jgi:hypothetical protein
MAFCLQLLDNVLCLALGSVPGVSTGGERAHKSDYIRE